MMPRADSPLDARMRVALTAVASVGGALSVVAAALFGARLGLSVAAGAAMAAGNLWALARVIAALLPGETSVNVTRAAESKGTWAFLAVLKTVGLLVAAWLILSYRVAAPLPMLVGFAALPIGIAIGALVSDRRPERKETL